MRVCLVALLVAISTLPLFGGIDVSPVNLGFEEGAAGWSVPDNRDYKSAVVAESHGGASALKIWSITEKPPEFGAAVQAIDATRFRGKFVRLRGWVRSEVTPPNGGGHLWLRVDRPEQKSAFLDNMMDRPIQGASWAAYEILGEVPGDATTIFFGGFLRGAGAMWIDDLTLTDADAELSALPPPSREAQRYLDDALAIMEKNSIGIDKVDWVAVRSRSLLLARGSKHPADTFGAIRYAVGQLRDTHSYFLPPAGAKQWRAEGASQPRPDMTILQGGVGYLNVPSYKGGDPAAIAKYAEDVQRRIAMRNRDARCGWVVDLRKNGGGNMWPMLSGLGPIIGEGELLALVRSDNRQVVVYRDGQAVDETMAVRKPGDEKQNAYTLEKLPAVAVLTSERTASSGEAVAIAFRGRPHTRSFGAPTAGLSTGNSDFRLEDDAILFLTTTAMADRTGRTYGGAVPPDVEINGDHETLVKAIEWLREESGCASK